MEIGFSVVENCFDLSVDFRRYFVTNSFQLYLTVLRVGNFWPSVVRLPKDIVLTMYCHQPVRNGKP